jgi:succinate dehydrogenase / fumarate reductase cytochrome b subunit
MNVALEFWRSTIGKKVTMAVTGIVMVLFLLGHVSGNLLVFKGPQAMDAYAAFLHSLGGGLWAARLVLVGSVILHALAAFQLTQAAAAARPQGYAKKKSQVSTLASRLMRWGGVVVAVYIVFHILHFTVGVDALQAISHERVYSNVVAGFSNPAISLFYLVAMAAIGLHLFHGVWSSARTLGIARPSLRPLERRLAIVIAVAVWAGFSIIPVAVLAGIVHN